MITITQTSSTGGQVSHELPALPSEATARSGDGYDWIDELTGWEVIAVWGSEGWELGQWPYQILAVCRTRIAGSPHGYGMATYCEGDIEVTAYETPEALSEAISRYAFSVWTLTENGPKDLPATFEELPSPYWKPYTYQTVVDHLPRPSRRWSEIFPSVGGLRRPPRAPRGRR